MTRACRPLALLVVAPFALGCGGESVTSHQTGVHPTPATVLNPQAPEPAKAAPDAPKAVVKKAGPSARLAALAVTSVGLSPAPGEEGKVTLVPVKFDELRPRIAAKKAKYTLVDAWATTCAPCKENFPHLVEMHRKYAGKGLAVVSLTLDDRDDKKALAAAEKFLREQRAVFTNYLLDEEFGVGFEKLDINAIPAVFLFGPDGTLVKRFTMDDPDHQFTYADVEKAVVALLAGKPLPPDPKGKAAKP
jgi:thiol-disulfide isomerase/thioredoxin